MVALFTRGKRSSEYASKSAMKKRTTLFFAAFILVATSLRSFAQTVPEQVPVDAAQIRGHVINARDNEPMALVQVELSGTTLRAISDDDGMFQITGVPPGDYVLQSTTVNFYPVRTPMTLSANEVRSIDIVMASSSAKLSSSVDVSADVFDSVPEPAAAGFTLEGEERNRP